MNEYLKAQTRTNAAILANTFSQDEFERFAKSDYRWLTTERNLTDIEL